MPISDLLKSIQHSIDTFDRESGSSEDVGFVLSVADGVVHVVGLDNVAIGESVTFHNGIKGLVLNLDEDCVGIVALGTVSGIQEGSEVKRDNGVLSVPVGKQFLGRVIDALGNPIDGLGEISSSEFRAIEQKAPGIMDRKSVCEPLQTGIKAIDSMIPIGRGQRELIIGDRQTGKTSILLDTIVNQIKFNDAAKHDSEKLFCIYVAIGQKRSSIARIAKALEKSGAMKNTIIVSSTSSEFASLQFLAPYVGCVHGEYFRDNGMHSLVVYDDLSKHAAVYRQMSLLLRRPPGREAYPADVFYLHSRLLERAARMSDEKGGGSLTALPVVETQSNDISAYIPTNVISITDGQIFLETELFNQGFRPAINIGLSVSRVGGAAQTKAMKKVSGKVKLDLAQFRELKTFSQFGSDLDDATVKVLTRGSKVSDIMKQSNNSPLTMAEQVIVLFAISADYLDKVHVDKIKEFEASVLSLANYKYTDLLDIISKTGVLTEDTEKRIHALLTDAVSSVETISDTLS